MKQIIFPLLAIAVLGACQAQTETKATECQIEDYTQAQALELKANKYEGLSKLQINQLALSYLPCLGSVDPVIRDGLVFESYSGWLRGDALSDETKLKLFESVLGTLNGPDSANGFTKPFTALDMSELARADRVEAYLTTEQRAALVKATAEYMGGITDYRGYDDKEGWRHGVAHTADLVLQLSLNPNISAEQITVLRAALTTQIAPASGHSYIFGEPERLARPILYMAQRGIVSQGDWQNWFAALTDPAPFEKWGDVYKSESGLAKLHNTKAFLNAVYINANETGNEDIKKLLAPARMALMKLP